MPSTLSLTYLPSASRSLALPTINFAGILRTQAFKVVAETLAVLSIFASLTIWAFAVSPSLSSL